MKVIQRFKNAIVMFIWAIRNPQLLNMSNFKMLSDLFVLIFKVAEEDRHYMTHIAFVHPEDNTEHQIVSIWAGAGIAADPVKRIAELQKEIGILKAHLVREQDLNKSL